MHERKLDEALVHLTRAKELDPGLEFEPAAEVRRAARARAPRRGEGSRHGRRDRSGHAEVPTGGRGRPALVRTGPGGTRTQHPSGGLPSPGARARPSRRGGCRRHRVSASARGRSPSSVRSGRRGTQARGAARAPHGATSRLEGKIPEALAAFEPRARLRRRPVHRRLGLERALLGRLQGGFGCRRALRG